MKEIQKGGLRLTKLISNDEEVMKSIPESKRSQSVKSAYQLENVNEKTLGVNWNIRWGYFHFLCD